LGRRNCAQVDNYERYFATAHTQNLYAPLLLLGKCYKQNYVAFTKGMEEKVEVMGETVGRMRKGTEDALNRELKRKNAINVKIEVSSQ
jgi:hypothetical protein